MNVLNNENKFVFSTRKVRDYARLMVDEGFTVEHILEMVGSRPETIFSWEELLSDTTIEQTKNHGLAVECSQQHIKDLTIQLSRSKIDMTTIAKAFVQLLLNIENQTKLAMEPEDS